MTTIILLLSIQVQAQAEMSKSADEQIIREYSSAWMTAAMHRDKATLDKLVAPEFKLGGTDITRPDLPREIWMKNTMENLKIDSTNYIRMHVDVFDQVAVVRSTFYWSVAFRDMPANPDTVDLVDTWLKRGNNWQVVNRLVVD